MTAPVPDPTRAHVLGCGVRAPAWNPKQGGRTIRRRAIGVDSLLQTISEVGQTAM
jgi:hypothetical protein